MSNRSGFYLVNKPIGMTSSDVVLKIKKLQHHDKIGHTGTLDKFAQGLLILPFGSYTCFSNKFLHLDKTYKAIIQFGKSTDSGDRDGIVIDEWEKTRVEEFVKNNLTKIKLEIENILTWTEQIPPKISALKVKGKRQAELFRQNIEFESKSRPMKIYSLNYSDINSYGFTLELEVSSGTYIRKIVQDLSELIGIPMYLSELTRLTVGKFKLSDANSMDKFSESNPSFLNYEKALDLEVFTLSYDEILKIKKGIKIPLIITEESEKLLIGEDKHLVAWIKGNHSKGEYSYNFCKVFLS